METPEDVQAAVDQLAETLGQSVLIEDRRQHPLWWSTRGLVDETRIETILNRTVDRRAARVVTDHHLRSALVPTRVPSIPEAKMWARWCLPVRVGDDLLGFVWVLDPDEFIRAEQLEPLVDCARLAGRVLWRAEQSSRQRQDHRDRCLQRLLDGPDLDRARELIELERLPADTHVQVGDTGRTGWPIADGLRVLITDHRPRIALSGAPLPLLELAEAVRRARAVRRCVRAGAQLETITWDALGAWRLIVDAPAELSPDQLHPGAMILAALPQSDLLDTARELLDRGGDVPAAATALHLHRTTLYYRLDRIRDLTGLDLRTDPARVDLHLALRLHAYRSVAD